MPKCPHSRASRTFVAVVVGLAFAAGATAPTMASPTPAAASVIARARTANPSAVTYQPPVDAPVVDGFRPPPEPWLAGNRGLDYATSPGTSVRAVADGEVIFAGAVGGTLHVTVLHPDGLRSSYSFLAGVTVAVGQRVVGGQPLGIAGAVFHVGVRLGDDTYIDPAALFASGAPEVHLEPGGDDHAPATALGANERSLFNRIISEAMDRTGMAERLRVTAAMARWVARMEPLQVGLRTVRAGADWVVAQQSCTEGSVTTPKLQQRHVAVLVGGIGSTSESAAITKLDTAELGYQPADVVRLSYAGGRVPGVPNGPGVAEHLAARPYTAADSQRPLRESAHELAELVIAAVAAAPGVPIDVLAHSQGGVVARLAVLELAERGTALPAGSSVVTLGSPHQGADLATGLAATHASPAGADLLDAASAKLGLSLDPGAPAVADLAEDSSVIAELALAEVPGVRVRSIAARGDLVVPSPRSSLSGMPAATIDLMGTHAHDELPGDPRARREVALALAGRAPSCSSLVGALGDHLAGEAVTGMEDRGLLALTALSWGASDAGWP
jgi:hypothetical protein